MKYWNDGKKEFNTMFSHTVGYFQKFPGVSHWYAPLPGGYSKPSSTAPPPKPESWIYPGFTYNTMWPINTRCLFYSSGSLMIDEQTSLL